MNLHDVKTRIDEISQKYIPKYVRSTCLHSFYLLCFLPFLKNHI